jgi:hypothetical protein
MSNSNPFNRPSMKIHRQQRVWQIFLPISLISLFIFFVGGYFVVVEGSQTRVWADISVIWIVLPLLVIFLIVLALLIGMIYLLYKVNRSTPIYTQRLQEVFRLIQQKSLNIADSIVKPVLWINQSQAGIIRLFRRK